MHIKIVSPTELEERRTELVRKSLELMLQQERSSARYAKRMRTILYELHRIQQKLDGQL